MTVFGSGGGYKGGFYKRLSEASSKSGRANACSSKDNMPLVKAEPNKNGGNTSVIIDFKTKEDKSY